MFGKRAGEHAATFARECAGGAPDASQIADAARLSVEPFERGGGGEGPYQVQYALQELMQDLVGIVRNEQEMQRALESPRAAQGAGAARRRRRASRVQPGLARGARPP